jgi:hypothetical protein
MTKSLDEMIEILQRVREEAGKDLPVWLENGSEWREPEIYVHYGQKNRQAVTICESESTETEEVAPESSVGTDVHYEIQKDEKEE